MAKVKTRNFGQVIRDRRRQLDLTQEEVARRISTSTPYIGHLESGKRHPSEKVVTKLADVLGLDRREMFFLANPGAKALLSQQAPNSATSAQGRSFAPHSQHYRRRDGNAVARGVDG
jgi:transcriptional regulator with XRE-family HTH domain